MSETNQQSQPPAPQAAVPTGAASDPITAALNLANTIAGIVKTELAERTVRRLHSLEADIAEEEQKDDDKQSDRKLVALYAEKSRELATLERELQVWAAKRA
jgi:hypothetical protein